MPEELSPPPIREFLDRGIKWLLETPENVRSLLRLVAADLADGLDFQRLEPLRTDFIPDNLREQQADLVFFCPFRDAAEEREVVIVLLIEHQSTPDPSMAFRLLYYMVLIWDTQRRQWLDEEAPKSQWRFRPILPIVFYTGTSTWTTGLDLAALMDLPEPLWRFVPRYDTLFLNLEATCQEELVAEDHPFGWLMWCLRQAEGPLEEFQAALRETLMHLEALPDRELQVWEKAIYYLALLIYHRREEPEQAGLLEMIKRGTGEQRRREEVETMGKTIAQALIEEGEARGLIQAKQEDLLAFLEGRFAPLPNSIYEQVRRIDDPERLSILIRRSATAATLAELDLAEEEVPVS